MLIQIQPDLAIQRPLTDSTFNLLNLFSYWLPTSQIHPLSCLQVLLLLLPEMPPTLWQPALILPPS